jgi:hypothetical protein
MEFGSRPPTCPARRNETMADRREPRPKCLGVRGCVGS